MTALISVDDYQRFTSDLTPSAPAVTGAIVTAQQLVDEHCKRHFAYGSYTETLPVSSNGRVYPKATPVEAVTSPSGTSLAGSAVRGAGAAWSLFDPLTGATTRTVELTYTGGYQPYGTASGVTPALPAKLALAIAKVAYNLLHPVVLAGVPSGTTSASVGDVSVSSSTGRDLSGLSDAVDESTARALKGYVRRGI